MKKQQIVRGLLGTGLVIVAGVLVIQQMSLGELKEESAAIREQQKEAERLAMENADLPRVRESVAQLEKLRLETKDFDRLLGEVVQLRSQSQKRSQLLVDNQRLATMSTNTSALRISQMPDYVSATNYVNAGFNTPEDALQTFLLAVKSGDLKKISECMMPEMAKAMMEAINKDPNGAAREFSSMQKIFAFKGYRIASKQETGSDKIVLQVQISSSGTAYPFMFKKANNEWKFADLSGPPQER